MPLHPEIIEHLERLDIDVPDDLDGSAVEILSAKVSWPATRYATCFDLWREQIVDSGVDDAENWSDDDVLEYASYTPHRTVGLRIGDAIFLDHYTGTDPEVSTCWSEDWAYIYFLEPNPKDPTDPMVTFLDHELVEEETSYNGTVSEFLAIIEPES